MSRKRAKQTKIQKEIINDKVIIWVALILLFIGLSYLIIKYKIGFVLIFLPVFIPIIYGWYMQEKIGSWLVGSLFMLIFFTLNTLLITKTFFIFYSPSLKSFLEFIVMLVFLLIPGVIGYFASKRDFNKLALVSIFWLFFITILMADSI